MVDKERREVKDEFKTSEITIGKDYQQDKLVTDNREYLSSFEREVDITGVESVGKDSGKSMLKIRPKGDNFSCEVGNKVDKNKPEGSQFESFLQCRGEQ